MDKEQLITALIDQGVLRTPKVIAAFRKVDRKHFIPDRFKKYAYSDIPLPLIQGQTISQPFVVAFMTEMLDVQNGQNILEVGAGSGYQSAILSELNKKGRIITIERIPELIETARGNLKDYKNVEVRAGDGSLGAFSDAPFDRIIATCATPNAPQPWIDQLNENGRIIAPIGERHWQDLSIIRKENERIIKESLHFPCAFVPLIGKFGWKR